MQAERLSDIPLGVKSDRKEGLLWYEDRRIKKKWISSALPLWPRNGEIFQCVDYVIFFVELFSRLFSFSV